MAEYDAAEHSPDSGGATTGRAASQKQRFKSKWNKVFKEKSEEEVLKSHHVNSFTLNDNVSDFLKPSIDAAKERAAAAPKIDIAIAQRWPHAHEVRRAHSQGLMGGDPQTPRAAGDVNGYVKPRRREGLVVGFIRTAPEIIGYGGDETLEPVSEISRRKAARTRSVSHAGYIPGGGPPDPVAVAHNGNPETLRPPPVRRALTSHDEVSAPLQRRQLCHSLEDDTAPLRGSNGTPTGVETRRDTGYTPFTRHEGSGHFDPYLGSHSMESEGSRLRPHDTELAARRRNLKDGEGLALRRASALIMQDNPEDNERRRESVSVGIQPPDTLYETLSRTDAEQILPRVPEATNTLPLLSTNFETSPSPFADPKYIKRHSQEVTPESASQQQPRHQPSYMQAPVPNQTNFSRPARTQEPPSYMRAPLPTQQQARIYDMPQVESPQQVSARGPGPQVFAHSRHQSQVDSVTNTPTFQIQPPEPMLQERIYARPNGSNVSLSRSGSASPHASHSQSHSREGIVTRAHDLPAASQVRPSLNHQPYDTMSPYQARHPSEQEKLASASTYHQALGPNDYNAAVSPYSRQSARSPAGSLRGNDSANRPGSAHSSRSIDRGPDYFSGPRMLPGQASRPPLANKPSEENRSPSSSGSAASPYSASRSHTSHLREADAQRPGSAGSISRPAISPQPVTDGNPQADLALADFAARVAHMRGVFKLTSEKERPRDRCSLHNWLRAALWWYLIGKMGLEQLLQARSRQHPDQFRELLEQPHVDLAKAWWMLSGPLDTVDDVSTPQSTTSVSQQAPEVVLQHSVALLGSHVKALALSMSRNQLMPPHQSLIQGQDTRIWLEYPRFTPDAAAVLGGSPVRSFADQSPLAGASPLTALPLGDTRNGFCYGRFRVDVAMSTDDAQTDRVYMPCILSILRSPKNHVTGFGLASQNELVNVEVGLSDDEGRGLGWKHVSWKANSATMVVHLPHAFDILVRMQERDMKLLWGMAESSQAIEKALRPADGERLVYNAQLPEAQYADSSGQGSFPHDKVRGCRMVVLEQSVEIVGGSGTRKMHNGYRLVLFTDPSHKTLCSASHLVCSDGPLLYEFITDSAASGLAAMVIRVREQQRQCRMLLVFPDVEARQKFYQVLSGVAIDHDETLVGKMTFTSLNIERADTASASNSVGGEHPGLRALQWQQLGVTNALPDDPNSRTPLTIESESLRIVARHATGCFTDRLNLDKGELLLRLPCAASTAPTLQLLRDPQTDLTVCIDTRNSDRAAVDTCIDLADLVRTTSTIRSYSFATLPDLHEFQTTITGFSVLYDGLAATFGIARRRMVVPIYKKWEASHVRLQIISSPNHSVYKVLAFMDEFSHADAMCFQVKSTDVFELIKGSADAATKGKKWAVKMVDAKFSLPHLQRTSTEGGDGGAEEVRERIKRRFVNLEGLEYAEEHDDITVGFDSEADRDRFAQSLPAAATTGRGLTLKRRI